MDSVDKEIWRDFMFDSVLTQNKIEYGIIEGNATVFYVKVGNGGSIYGYENKYWEIAKQIHMEYGCSVLVASNPINLSIKDGIELDLKFIKERFPNANQILAFGHSNGGQMLVSYAYAYPIINKVLAVNVPLMINLHKTKEGISNFKQDKIYMVYGSRDPSYRYVEILNSSVTEKFEYVVVENADHHFKNMLKEFMELPKRFLF